MLTRRKMLAMVAGIPLLGGLFGKRDVTDDVLWKEVGNDFTPPDGIGTYIVINDGDGDGLRKVRSGIAQWGYNGKELSAGWEVTDGDIEPDEIYYCIPLPEHPSRED